MIIKKIEIKPGEVKIHVTEEAYNGDAKGASVGGPLTYKDFPPTPGLLKAWEAFKTKMYDILEYGRLEQLNMSGELSDDEQAAYATLERRLIDIKDRFSRNFIIQKIEFDYKNNEGNFVRITGGKQNYQAQISKVVTHDVFYDGDMDYGYEGEIKKMVSELRLESMDYMQKAANNELTLFTQEDSIEDL
tara:strand:+ start:468 stop:1034 length:567 start_codon:yes stop_codon:yes gene_type:complete